MEVIQDWPPITRVLTLATVGISILAHSGILPILPLIFIPSQIFQMPPKIPEIWRLVTAFCITGPKFGIIMDPYFLFTYGSGLERNSTRFSEPGSFFMYIVFVMSIISAVGGYYLGGFVLLSALTLAFAYTFSQDNPTTNVSFYIVSFQAKYLPFALLILTFVLDGPDSAKTQVSGLLAAHLYDFLTRIWPTFGGGTNYLVTPGFVKNWFVSGQGPRPVRERGFGTAIPPRQEAPRDPWSSNRGPGRRLGGD